MLRMIVRYHHRDVDRIGRAVGAGTGQIDCISPATLSLVVAASLGAYLHRRRDRSGIGVGDRRAVEFPVGIIWTARVWGTGRPRILGKLVVGYRVDRQRQRVRSRVRGS